MMESSPKRSSNPDGWTRLAIAMLALVGIIRKRGRTSTAGPALPSNDPSDPAILPRSGATNTIEPQPGLLGIAQTVFERFGRDNISLMAAGIAFYILAALFPALAAVVSIYGLVADPNQVAQRINELGGLLPPEALKIITTGLDSFAQKSGSQLSLALLVSLVLALWTARAGMSAVMTGLTVAYEETEKRSFVVQNLVALALTLGGIVFAIIAILVVAVIPAVLALLQADSIVGQIVNIARWPVLALVVVMVFAAIYRYAPSRPRSNWTWITWGSGIAAILWMVGSVIFSFYVSHFGTYQATYGALGGVVVLLLWFWVSALVLLLGAEIDGEISSREKLLSSPWSRPAANTSS